MTTCGALQVITVRFNMARVVDHNKKCNKEAAKQHLQAEQSKFEAARQLGGTFDVPPEDADHEDVIEKARMELGRPVAPAVPCVAKQGYHPLPFVREQPLASVYGGNLPRVRKNKEVFQIVKDESCWLRTKIRSRTKDAIRSTFTDRYTLLFPVTQAMRIPAIEAAACFAENTSTTSLLVEPSSQKMTHQIPQWQQQKVWTTFLVLWEWL